MQKHEKHQFHILNFTCRQAITRTFMDTTALDNLSLVDDFWFTTIVTMSKFPSFYQMVLSDP